MDSMEKSHALQSSVVSSLFTARQFIWTELSSVISGVREQFDQAEKERNRELDRLHNENRSLNDLLNRLNEILEGKELEIHGLRRQLQSFYSAKPICSACSREINISNDSKAAKVLGGADEKEAPHKPHTYYPFTNERTEVRKRLRSSTSLSSSSPVSSAIGKAGGNAPHSHWAAKSAHKRQCTRASLGVPPLFPIVLLRDTQAFSEEENDFMEPVNQVPTNAQTNQKEATSVEFTTKNKTSPHLGENRVFRMTELSPPTQHFDASMAIENAVNHSDLDAGEYTRLDSMVSTATYVQDTADEQESITLSVDTQEQTSKFVFRRLPPPKSRSRMIASQLLHRHLGVGLSHRSHRSVRNNRHRQSSTRLAHRKEKHKTADNTTTDVSLPSDILESERSMVIPGSQVIGDANASPSARTLAKQPAGESELHLPSIGGSPTNQDQRLFKRPKVPASHPIASPRCLLKNEKQPYPIDSDALETQHSSQVADHSNNTGGTENKENQPLPDTVTALHSVDDKSGNAPCEVKYVGPVERNKEARRQLHGYSCASCREYYASIGLSSPEIANRIHRCSRHRALHGAPPSTPKGYWDIDISNSECKIEDMGNEQPKRSRRRRPLNFPTGLCPATDSKRTSRHSSRIRDIGNRATNSPG